MRKSLRRSIRIHVNIPPVDFDQVMSSETWRTTFKHYLESARTAELLEFVEDVERFEKLTDFNERLEFGQKIYNTYLSTKAPKEINISRAFVLPVVLAFKSRGEERRVCLRKSLFKPIKIQILNLLKYDSFPRFLQTQILAQVQKGDEKSKKKIERGWASRAKAAIKSFFKPRQRNLTKWQSQQEIDSKRQSIIRRSSRLSRSLGKLSFFGNFDNQLYSSSV